jgi:hypothetical protein
MISQQKLIFVEGWRSHKEQEHTIRPRNSGYRTRLFIVTYFRSWMSQGRNYYPFARVAANEKLQPNGMNETRNWHVVNHETFVTLLGSDMCYCYQNLLFVFSLVKSVNYPERTSQ